MMPRERESKQHGDQTSLSAWTHPVQSFSLEQVKRGCPAEGRDRNTSTASLCRAGTSLPVSCGCVPLLGRGV